MPQIEDVVATSVVWLGLRPSMDPVTFEGMVTALQLARHSQIENRRAHIVRYCESIEVWERIIPLIRSHTQVSVLSVSWFTFVYFRSHQIGRLIREASRNVARGVLSGTLQDLLHVMEALERDLLVALEPFRVLSYEARSPHGELEARITAALALAEQLRCVFS